MPSSSGSSTRLQALRESGLLDSLPEPEFDRLTALASSLLKAPVALISLVDADRQFFKSQFGLPEPYASMRETPLSHSFCQHVSDSGRPLIVEDARVHELVKDNLAVGELGVIAYAGVPLKQGHGPTLGAFCAIDSRPRQWTLAEVEILETLAAQVMTELRLRRQAQRLLEGVGDLAELESERQQVTQLTVHDLRAPLMGFSLNLALLEECGVLNAEQQNAVVALERGARDLGRLVDDLLDIGNLNHLGDGSMHAEPCDARRMIAEAIQTVAPVAASKQVRMCQSIEADDPTLVGDQDKLIRVLINILSNAVKFTPAGGSVSIATMDGSPAFPGHPGLQFMITDTGIGIRPENLARIFEFGVKVNRADPTSRSTGLGLAFCQRVITAHQGSIWAESQLGAGTQIYIFLPRQPK